MKTKLTHHLYEYSPPEAGKDDIFGQYLFAPIRPDVPSPKEPNTKEEDKLFKAIKGMFENKGDAELRKFATKIIKLLADNKYEPYLSSGERKAYRGIRISEQALLKLIEPYGEEIQYDEYVTMNLPDVFKPLKGTLLQSWSADVYQAAKFAAYKRPERTVSIVFVARTNAEGNNFFGNPKALAWLISPDYEEEAEVISVGNVEYDGFAYYVAEGTDGFPGDVGKHIEDLMEAAENVE
jgi:hypothetical protein